MLFTSRAIVGAVISALAAALLSAPALAQTPPAAPAKEITDFDDLSEQQQDELYCVYDAIGDDKDAQALQDWIVFSEKDKEKVANAVFDRASATCKAKHKWNDEQTEVASVVAKAGVLTDLMENELRSEGFDDKKLEALLGINKQMTQPDFQALLELAYGKKPDEAAIKRVETLLYGAGVPKGGDVIDLAMSFLASSLQERDAIFVWMDEQLFCASPAGGATGAGTRAGAKSREHVIGSGV